MFKIEDSGEDRRMVCDSNWWRWDGADTVVGEPEIEVEDVPYLVTDESHEAGSTSVELRSGFSIHTYIHALHI